jgi:hypothetical protein
MVSDRRVQEQQVCLINASKMLKVIKMYTYLYRLFNYAHDNYVQQSVCMRGPEYPKPSAQVPDWGSQAKQQPWEEN